MKWLCVLLVLLLFSGCAAQETFETVSDWYYEPVISAGAIRLSLPEDAAVLASRDDGGSIYLCEGYTLCLQTLEAGDLNKTLRAVSGFGDDQLRCIQTQQAGVTRYDFVWAAAGETGDQLCRGAILDDGYFHYTLSVMSDADRFGDLSDTWDRIFSSFSISEPKVAEIS